MSEPIRDGFPVQPGGMAAWLHQLTAVTASEDILAGHGLRGGKALIATLRWRLIAVPGQLIRHAHQARARYQRGIRRAGPHPLTPPAATTYPARPERHLSPSSGSSHRLTRGIGSEQVFRYYLCGEGRMIACPANRVPAGYLEELAARLFLGLVGNQEILERVYIAAEDSSAELAAVKEAMEHLEAVRSGCRVSGRNGSGAVCCHDDAPGRATGPAGGAALDARTPVAPADIAAEARRQGIPRTTRELRSRAANLRFMATKATNPERLAALEVVEVQRQRLRGIRRYNEVVSFALDEDLARRAGLAAAGKPVEIPDVSQQWDAALEPLREALKGT